MTACLGVAVADDDGGELAFGASAALAFLLGAAALLVARRLPVSAFRPRDGFFAVTAVWVLAAAVGALPFLVHGTFASPSDAFFESMSGFTTTGATMLLDIEAEPRSILLWRSLSQWLGGVGIIVLVVAIAPATGLASQRFFFAETSGPTAERLTPRIADTAKIIWGIYLALTAAGFVAYLAAGMPAFDAVNHILTTLATGGYSTRTASIAAFDSVAIEAVAIVLMVMAGVNFAFYWRALRGDANLFPQLAEIRAYLVILALAMLAVAASLVASGDIDGFPEALRASSFTVASVMTTTGYTTSDFDLWNDFARVGLLALMFVGGCAGSTAGGLKVIRVVLLGKSAAQEVRQQLQPKAVQVLRVRGRIYSEQVRRNVLGFFYIYVLVAVGGTLVMAALGLDLVTAGSSVAATLNVVGPGLGEVGSAESYAAVPEGGRWVLSGLMLLGRLEIFTVLVLLAPAFWRRGRA
jgi:trk system potassium uptake protein